MVRIIQQRAKCIGCNACVEAAPQRWIVSKKDGKCVLVGGIEKRGYFQVTIPDHELEENLLAAKNCPVHIIQVLPM
ncbi:MAG: ferredoxin [Chitinophagales bacterium]